jgi:hypothetical protein
MLRKESDMSATPYETARATSQALIRQYPHVKAHSSSGTESSAFWYIRLVLDSVRAVTIIRQVGGKSAKVLIVRNRRIVSSESDLSGYKLGQAICMAVIGQTWVPIESRNLMRKVIEAATIDADRHFTTGLSQLALEIPKNDEVAQRWFDSDHAERWEMLTERATTAVTVPHMEQMRLAQVPMQVMDVYDDTYYDRANQLLGNLLG